MLHAFAMFAMIGDTTSYPDPSIPNTYMYCTLLMMGSDACASRRASCLGPSMAHRAGRKKQRIQYSRRSMPERFCFLRVSSQFLFQPECRLNLFYA